MSARYARGWSPGPALLHRNNWHRHKSKHSLTLPCKIQKSGEPLFFTVLTRPAAASQRGHCSPRAAAGPRWAARGQMEMGEKGFAPQEWSQDCQPLPESSWGCPLFWSLCHRSFPWPSHREERRTGAYLAGNFNQISDPQLVFGFTNAIKESNCINQNHIILPIIKFPLTPLFTLPLLIN